MGEDTRAEGDVLVEIALREAISVELELRRADISKVSVEDSKGIQVGDVVAADLVCADEELYLLIEPSASWYTTRCFATHLQMVIKLALASMESWRHAVGRQQARGRRESLAARQALGEAGEVDVPGGVDGVRVLLPKTVHLVGVVRVRAIREWVVRGRRLRGGRRELPADRAGRETRPRGASAESSGGALCKLPCQHVERRLAHLPEVFRGGEMEVRDKMKFRART